eukprot:TRINITY_DN3931_c0_g2_i2.p1 TRINITY_DN3931_c0_g2~~TRINITY_DN3931_c0_g2_i2.p1  ORF type:complete len:148 (+),score=10.90 TRINITY_DN3931_c0_g2_i2:65-508(+)
MSDTYNMKRSIVANVPIVATISLCLLVSLTQGADPLSTNFLDIEGPTICAAKPTCGNGKVESIGLPYTNRPESEECDDGNTINGMYILGLVYRLVFVLAPLYSSCRPDTALHRPAGPLAPMLCATRTTPAPPSRFLDTHISVSLPHR